MARKPRPTRAAWVPPEKREVPDTEPRYKDLPRGLRSCLARNRHPGSADSAALLADLIEIWGGTRALAIDVKKEYDKAPQGGMTRQRILEMLQRLIITNTTHEISRAIRPADMTDQELDALVIHYMKRVADEGRPVQDTAAAE